MKKFTQAYNIYENLHKAGVSTPSMYLKMAFIKEGLGDVSNAMFYLNQYYYATFDKRVLKKMETLAAEHHLAGYEYEDFEFFQNMLLKNSHWIHLFLVAICFLLFVMLVYKRFFSAREVKGTATALCIFVALFLFYNNFPIISDFGIINSSEAFIMEEPSAAAGPLATVKKGNKLKILSSGDIWVKIEYNDQIGYIRDHNLLMMTPSEKAY